MMPVKRLPAYAAEVREARERLQRAVDEGNKIWAGMAYSFAPRIHVLRADLAILLAAERSMEQP